MHPAQKLRLLIAFFAALLAAFVPGRSLGQTNSSVIKGKVTDSTGAIISGAPVVLYNPVSGFRRISASSSDGSFAFYNVPFDYYSISVEERNFGANRSTVNVISSVPLTINIQLKPQTNQSVTVTADSEGPLSETSPTYHTDVDRTTIDRLPIESPSSGLSSIVTLASPGVAADSNGLLHGLGDHNEDSFSVDGEPISDQQSKVFSNQLPAAAIQSLQVIDGAPPVEYGDKTSLVVTVTTRSGQGVMSPTGTVHYSYGTFGSSVLGFDEAQGNRNWGNFIAADGLQTGRFLDAPEFNVFHDKGNEENVFDRVDFNMTPQDAMHVNFQYTRSWFQTPNDYENLASLAYTGQNLGIANTDQRSKIGTINFSPTYTHVINSNAVVNVGAFVRRDAYNYYPSSNPMADYALDQQQESISQFRTLTNAGIRTDVSYNRGMNTFKLGGVYQQTFLRENDNVGIVDPGLVAGCSSNPAALSNCTALLTPYDLTAGGSYYQWHGRTDIKQVALYGEDTITKGNFTANLGLRGDFYNGMAIQRQAEPRAGISYNIKPSKTVLRISYARTQETPFNENLVLSSTGCADPILYSIFATLSAGQCAAQAVTPFNPGFRNEFHAGFSQAVGRHFVATMEYLTKYTHNAYDFSVLGTTPITFPIEWHSSKIPGFAGSATLTDIKGLSVRFNASSVAARFYNPQLGGVGATPNIAGGFPFRIDHDEHFNETTHVEYAMPFRKSMYYAFNWRYDSGLVAGAAPCFNIADPNSICNPANGGPSFVYNNQNYVDLSYLSPDQQSQAGLACNGIKATPTTGTGAPVGTSSEACLAAQLTSNLVAIPAPGTENDDKNPQRIQPRNVFDMALGDGDIFHFGDKERYKISASVTAINVANKYALYNFLSTFSGTHYLTPRTVTGQVAFHF
jgi:hypothetical protein